eukprot:TRINITY_DN1491_c0_g2_i1.p1 TRINITY_DN1491_c0_g2~~TRINITY_DN1491_c0_g2_i1.p1  ORF type:complete len:161 (+),score=75.81 TRINITY_DN1491_c0_g2_i1:44-484(+)
MADRDRGGWRGSCYCGAVRFVVGDEAGGEPPRACFCHCDSCRRAHSAPMYQVVYVDEGLVRVEAGQELVRGFSKSERIERQFCSRCGSRLFNKVKSLPGKTGFFPALLEEGSQRSMPERWQPKYHCHVTEAVLPLSSVADGLERRE